MTKADLAGHGLIIGHAVKVTAPANTDKRRRQGVRLVQGTVYAINDYAFTLDTARGFESFLLVDLLISGPERIIIEPLRS